MGNWYDIFGYDFFMNNLHTKTFINQNFVQIAKIVGVIFLNRSPGVFGRIYNMAATKSHIVLNFLYSW